MKTLTFSFPHHKEGRGFDRDGRMPSTQQPGSLCPIFMEKSPTKLIYHEDTLCLETPAHTCGRGVRIETLSLDGSIHWMHQVFLPAHSTRIKLVKWMMCLTWMNSLDPMDVKVGIFDADEDDCIFNISLVPGEPTYDMVKQAMPTEVLSKAMIAAPVQLQKIVHMELPSGPRILASAILDRMSFWQYRTVKTMPRYVSKHAAWPACPSDFFDALAHAESREVRANIVDFMLLFEEEWGLPKGWNDGVVEGTRMVDCGVLEIKDDTAHARACATVEYDWTQWPQAVRARNPSGDQLTYRAMLRKMIAAERKAIAKSVTKDLALAKDLSAFAQFLMDWEHQFEDEEVLACVAFKDPLIDGAIDAYPFWKDFVEKYKVSSIYAMYGEFDHDLKQLNTNTLKEIIAKDGAAPTSAGDRTWYLHDGNVPKRTKLDVPVPCKVPRASVAAIGARLAYVNEIRGKWVLRT